jgi:hypothetical protein
MKEANLQVAVFIHEDIGRFEIAMNNAGRVNVLSNKYYGESAP